MLTSTEAEPLGDIAPKGHRSISQEPSSITKTVNSQISDRHLVRLINDRRTTPHAGTEREITKRLVPRNDVSEQVGFYHCRPYCGQFSPDGTLYYSGTQDFSIHIYDTSDPDEFRLSRRIQCVPGRWTMTDCSVSAAGQIAYSTISPTVHVTTVHQEGDHIALDFAEDDDHWYSFGIWSLRFNENGKELIAGASDGAIYAYDIQSKMVVDKIFGHQDDVNAVCFADMSSNVIYSGSDDSTIKVWDRRSLRDNVPAGVLPGHTEGITHISARGNYLLSNSKDQTMKLWDTRKMMSSSEFSEMISVDPHHGDYRQDWDYRYDYFPSRDTGLVHPNDASVKTFEGHEVLVTLIRCGFGPEGLDFVFSGSSDGVVTLWNQHTGELVNTFSVLPYLRGLGPRTPNRRRYHSSGGIVRDVAWHPYRGQIVCTFWEASNAGGLVRFKRSN